MKTWVRRNLSILLSVSFLLTTGLPVTATWRGSEYFWDYQQGEIGVPILNDQNVPGTGMVHVTGGWSSSAEVIVDPENIDNKILKFENTNNTVSARLNSYHAFFKGIRAVFSTKIYIPNTGRGIQIRLADTNFDAMLIDTITYVYAESFGEKLKHPDGTDYTIPKEQWVEFSVLIDNTVAGQINAMVFIDGVCMMPLRTVFYGDFKSTGYLDRITYQGPKSVFFIDDTECRVADGNILQGAVAPVLMSPHIGNNVNVDDKIFTVGFLADTDRFIETDTYSGNISVSMNGAVLTEGDDYILSYTNTKKVSIIFKNRLQAGTYYSVSFGEGIKNFAQKSIIAKTFVFTTTTQPPVTEYTSPTQEEVLAKYNMMGVHPKIQYTAADAVRVRNLVATNLKMQGWFELLKEDVDSYLNSPAPPYNIYDGLRLDCLAANRAKTLAFVYLITQDAKYAAAAWRNIEEACNYPDWNHKRHFLDVADMARGIAVAYDWCYDYLSEQQRIKVENALKTFVLDRALECYNGTATYSSSYWPTNNRNWNIVCNTGVMVAALAIFDTNPNFCSQIISKGYNSLEYSLNMYAPDGGFIEGVSYWDYATSNLVDMFEASMTALGTDFDYYYTNSIPLTGAFPVYLNGLKRGFNFGDSYNKTAISETSYYFAKRNNDPSFAKVVVDLMEQNSVVGGILMLKWYDPGFVSETGFFPDAYFRGVEAGSMRSGTGGNHESFLGFKGGENGEGHGNLDIGTFVFDSADKRWAEDLGRDNYNYPNYFGVDRYRYYANRGEGQNILLINPKGKMYDQSITGSAFMTDFSSGQWNAYSIFNTTGAYESYVTNARRGFMLTKNRQQAVIRDEIILKTSSDIWWFMHTKANIELKDNGRTAILTYGSSKCIVSLECSVPGASFSIMNAEHFEQSPKPAPQYITNLDAYRKLAVNVSAPAGDFNLTVNMLAYDLAKDENPIMKSITNPLCDWHVYDNENPYSTGTATITSGHMGNNVGVDEKSITIDLGNRYAKDTSSYSDIIYIFENNKLLREDVDYTISPSNPYSISIHMKRPLCYGTPYKITLSGVRNFLFTTKPLDVSSAPPEIELLLLGGTDYTECEPISVNSLIYAPTDNVDLVRYYLNGELCEIVSSYPYDKVFANLETGIHNIKAVAVFEDGLQIESTSLTVNVSELPAIDVVVMPADGSVVYIDDNVELMAYADGAQNVRFNLDGMVISNFISPPYKTVHSLLPGVHTFTVTAYDFKGRAYEKASTFTVTPRYKYLFTTNDVDFNIKTSVNSEGQSYIKLSDNLFLTGTSNAKAFYAEADGGRDTCLGIESVFNPNYSAGFTDWSSTWHDAIALEFEIMVPEYGGRTINMPSFSSGGVNVPIGFVIENGVLKDDQGIEYKTLENKKWYKFYFIADAVTSTVTFDINGENIVTNKSVIGLSGIIRPSYWNFNVQKEGSILYIDNYKSAYISRRTEVKTIERDNNTLTINFYNPVRISTVTSETIKLIKNGGIAVPVTFVFDNIIGSGSIQSANVLKVISSENITDSNIFTLLISENVTCRPKNKSSITTAEFYGSPETLVYNIKGKQQIYITDSAFWDSNDNRATGIPGDGLLCFRTKVYSSQERTSSFFVIGYKNGKMVKLEKQNVFLIDGENYISSGYLDFYGCDVVKAVLWDMASLEPFMKVTEIKI